MRCLVNDQLNLFYSNRKQQYNLSNIYMHSNSDFYKSSGQQQVFQKLKLNIERLKGEREQLNGALSVDRNDLANVQGAMNQLSRELDQRMQVVRQKQRKLMEIEKAINQTQKSYQIIVETTNKLSNALQNEASHLRSMTRKS